MLQVGKLKIIKKYEEIKKHIKEGKVILTEFKDGSLEGGVFAGFSQSSYYFNSAQVKIPASISVFIPFKIEHIKANTEDIINRNYQSRKDEEINEWIHNIAAIDPSQLEISLFYLEKGNRELRLNSIEKIYHQPGEITQSLRERGYENLNAHIADYIENQQAIPIPTTINGRKVIRPAPGQKVTKDMFKQMMTYPSAIIDLRNLPQGESQRDLQHMLNQTRKIWDIKSKSVFVYVNQILKNYIIESKSIYYSEQPFFRNT